MLHWPVPDRGGGERGLGWHRAGRLEGKQRGVEDLAASIQWLFDLGVSRPGLAALTARSAGAVLVGALCNQQPHLLRAVTLQVIRPWSGESKILPSEHASAGIARANRLFLIITLHLCSTFRTHNALYSDEGETLLNHHRYAAPTWMLHGSHFAPEC